MKKLLMLLAVTIMAIGTSAFASSDFLDDANLSQCWGKIQLREAGNGDYSLKLKKVQRCSNVIVKDSKGKVIKQYSMAKGGKKAPYTATYTLSKKMIKAAQNGRDLTVLVTGNGRRDTITVDLATDECKNYRSDKGMAKYTGYACSSRQAKEPSCRYYENGRRPHKNKTYPLRKCQ